MNKSHCYFILVAFATIFVACKQQQDTSKIIYLADWKSIEQYNPVPEWFKDAKFGIYFHWGVYSVPAFGNEWYPRHMYRPGSKHWQHHIENYGNPEEWPYHFFIKGNYDKRGRFVQFAPKLKSEGGNFDPDEWAQLFLDAGARFAGPVAEHHDGFSMWASNVNPWNALNYGPEMDLVGVLVDAIRERNMKIILSMHHAFHCCPEDLSDGTTRQFFDHAPKTNDPELQILYAQLSQEDNEELWLEKHKEIIDKYKPDIIWQDFNLIGVSEPFLLEFLAYYYNRGVEWGQKVVATYKDALNNDCAVLDYERGGPEELTDYYWITDDAISHSSWSYTEGLTYYTPKQVLHSFFDRISKNGNLLLNISPMADGTIPEEQKEILYAMGNWLNHYGEAVYSTRAWKIYGEGPTKMGAGHKHIGDGEFEIPVEGTANDFRFTRSKDNKTLYAIMLGWPGDNKTIKINSLSPENLNVHHLEKVEFLGATNNQKLQYRQDQLGMYITLPEKLNGELAYVIRFKLNSELN